MSQPPTLDNRSREELLAEFTERADQYVEGWESSDADMASVLLRIGSEFGGDLIDQLNRLPTKHRAAFLDSLGKQPQPPQAARLPLSVTVSSDLDRNVTVGDGTQAVAERGDGETELFEIPQGRGFEATPASLVESYAVDPAADRLVSHEPLTDGNSQQLFAGENRQQHAIYFGDESLLQLDPGSVIELTLQGSVDARALTEGCVWEYYGVDDEGAEGWQRALTGEDAELEASSTDELLTPQLDRQSSPTESRDEYSVRLRFPNELVETSVEEQETLWIRCRLDPPKPACFSAEIESVRATVGQSTDTDRLTPDAGFTNDVPLALDGAGDIRPFGRQPQPSSTVYLAAAEALTKPGGHVTLTFGPPTDGTAVASESATASSEGVGSETGGQTEVDFGALSGPPEVSWEYWNGTGWAGLAVQSDTTEDLQTAGEIQFAVPNDIVETAVSGTEARWIRGRLVGGSYGQLSVGLTDLNSDTAQPPEPPCYGEISLRYEHTESSFTHVLTENSGVREPVAETEDGYQPFEQLPEAHQTIYFGFDDVLRNGPIPLFVPLAETSYSQGFDPGVQWEYCTDPETDRWSRLPVEDGTGGLTERGIVSLQFPDSTTAHEQFGSRRHWVRAVVSGDSFATAVEPNRSTRPASSEGGESAAQPPLVEGLYPNTQWADNARTVQDETLGASDGSVDLEFACAHGPLLDCEVWVDEADSLSAAERDDLRETDPDRVETVTDDHGELEAVWVRWTPVTEFVGVGGESRIYRCDRSAGTIRFGDGDCGRIPPRGQPVRATYTTGGGEGGNVEAGAITHLKTPISLVESVDNPLPADGGASGEPMDGVASRAASELRTRGKAVTATDFEQVAATAVRKLAAVKCKQHLGPDGERTPGWITLLIVPDTDQERPRPSTELKQRVKRAVCQAAPARVTDGEEPWITIRGPSYTPVSVEATVQSTGLTSISGLKTEIQSALAAHLHPLRGGSAGTGLEFGKPPTAESLLSLLSSVEGVERVTELSATVQIADETVQLRRGPTSIRLPADGLVCSGRHEITVQLGDQR